MHGWMGKALRVNLSSRKYNVEDLDCDFAKKILKREDRLKKIKRAWDRGD